MTTIYTWDVYSTLDGFASYTSEGDWGGYWGKEGPEFLAHRAVVINADQRLVLGANTFRQFAELLGPTDVQRPGPGQRPHEEHADNCGVEEPEGATGLA